MDIFYQDYFSVHYAADGNVDSVSANAGLINQVNTILQTEIQNRLNAFRTFTTELPFGALSGSSFLSDYGFPISVRAELVGNCYTKLKSEFSDYGINNTLHRLLIDCVVEMEMVVPTGIVLENVTNEFVLAETVISGKVPSTYLGENTNTNYLDLLPD